MDNKETDVIRFTVPGPPQGKARARTFYNSRLGRMQSVTPENTVLYENLVKTCFALEARGRRFEDGMPISVSITAFFSTPKSATKKKRTGMLEGYIRPIKKPDIDNILKAVLDALNGIAYHDDTQVVEAFCRKAYAETPRVEVTLGISEDPESS